MHCLLIRSGLYNKLDTNDFKPKLGTDKFPCAEFQTDSEAYLSDAFGREVTPLIVPRPEPDKRESPETKEQKEQRQAAAELKKLTDQRRREGLTMGREGSQLVTDKRRRGFLDDEDFEDVIYDSD